MNRLIVGFNATKLDLGHEACHSENLWITFDHLGTFNVRWKVNTRGCFHSLLPPEKAAAMARIEPASLGLSSTTAQRIKWRKRDKYKCTRRRFIPHGIIHPTIPHKRPQRRKCMCQEVGGASRRVGLKRWREKKSDKKTEEEKEKTAHSPSSSETGRTCMLQSQSQRGWVAQSKKDLGDWSHVQRTCYSVRDENEARHRENNKTK